MDCRKAIELINLETGNEIPRELLGHLESCSGCKAEFRAQEGLIGTLKGLNIPEPPEVFWEGLRAGIRDDLDNANEAGTTATGWLAQFIRLPVLSGWSGRLVPAALALVLLVFVSVMSLRDKGTPDGQALWMVELIEEGVEIRVDMDEEEANIASLVIGVGEASVDIYYEMLTLEDDELDKLYDSLGRVLETL